MIYSGGGNAGPRTLANGHPTTQSQSRPDQVHLIFLTFKNVIFREHLKMWSLENI